MSDEVLVKVEGVSKKFCRSLKRSLWYGVQDVSAEMFGRKGTHDELRKNEFWAVNDVSFELKRGECLGLIGPNGAGKSSLLKMLNGLVKPDQGRITMRGRVGALIELGAGFSPILTARENIYVNGSVLGFTTKEIDQRFDAIVDFAEIEAFVDTPVQNYSSGMKVRLGFAVAAQMAPDVLIIDEVLAVGDVGFRAKCLNLISEISGRAATILVSHSMPDIARTASKIMLLTAGNRTYLGDDVAEGIARYMDLFWIANSKGQETTRCKLLSFRTTGEFSGERDTAYIDYGTTLTIDLMCLLDIGFKKCAINMNIVDSQQGLVAQLTSVKDNFFLFGDEMPQCVQIRVPNIPLSLGKYRISIYFVEQLDRNRRGEIFMYKHDVAEFQVMDETPGYAPVILTASWRKNKPS